MDNEFSRFEQYVPDAAPAATPDGSGSRFDQFEQYAPDSVPDASSSGFAQFEQYAPSDGSLTPETDKALSQIGSEFPTGEELNKASEAPDTGAGPWPAIVATAKGMVAPPNAEDIAYQSVPLGFGQFAKHITDAFAQAKAGKSNEEVARALSPEYGLLKDAWKEPIGSQKWWSAVVPLSVEAAQYLPVLHAAFKLPAGAVGEIRPPAVGPELLTPQTIEAKLPLSEDVNLGGELNAISQPETAQSNGNVLQPEVPTESAGQMPADVGSEGIPASGQREILEPETSISPEQITEPVISPESPAAEQPTEVSQPIAETAAPVPTEDTGARPVSKPLDEFQARRSGLNPALQLADGEVVEAGPKEATHAQILDRLLEENHPNVISKGDETVTDGWVDAAGNFLTKEEVSTGQRDTGSKPVEAKSTGQMSKAEFEKAYPSPPDFVEAGRYYKEASANEGKKPSKYRDWKYLEHETPSGETYRSVIERAKKWESEHPDYPTSHESAVEKAVENKEPVNAEAANQYLGFDKPVDKYGYGRPKGYVKEGDRYVYHDTGAPPVQPKLLPGETQGDLISSTQEEPLKLVGEETPDFEAQMTKAQKAELARMKFEEEQAQLSDFQDYQQRGGQELIDTISSLGGIRETAPDFGTVREAFLGKSKHATQASARSVVGDIRYGDLFKKNAPHEDALVEALRERGFDVETPGQLADILDTRLKTGKEIWGMESRAQEGDVSGLQGYALGAAGAKEIPEPTAVYLRNAKVDHARMARGELPLMSPARKAMGKTWEEGMQRIEKDPNLGDQMVTDILNGDKKSISESDHAVLLHERIRVGNERSMEADRSMDPNVSEEDRAAAHLRFAALEDRLNDIDHATQQAGTISGRALQFRQAVMRDDYTPANMERQLRAAKKRPLQPEEVAEVQKESARIEEAGKKADAAGAAEAEAREEKASQESFGSLLRESKSSKPVNLEEQQGKIVQSLKRYAAKGEDPKNLTSFIQSLALNFVRKGIREREPLIDAVHNVIKDIFPDMSRSDTRNAISGYGQFKALDPEAAKVTLRDLKGQMQQLGKIQDMAERNEAPKKTGIERRTPSDEERRLIKEVNELKKKGGYDVLDPAKALKSAQDAVKTRLRNVIADREHALATGEKMPGNKPIPTDAEIDALRAKADALGKQYKEKFPVSEADRRRIALQAHRTRMQNVIVDLEDRLARKDFSKPTRPKIQLASENIKLQQKADSLRMDWKRGLYKYEQANLPWWQRALDKTARAARFAALSGYHTLEKIVGYSLWKAAETPMTEAAGQLTKFIPGMKAVGRRANLETGPFARSIARYYKDLTVTGGKEAIDVLRNYGKSAMKSGKKDLRTPDWTDFFGVIHQAEKSIPLSGQAGLHLEKATANAIANGVDVSDPIVRAALRKEAVDYAQRAILQEDNRFAQWVNDFNRRMTAVDKATGEPNAVRVAIADGIQTLLTKGIIKTPANYVVQSLERTPAGLGLGAAKLAKTWIKGTDTLTPAAANTISRLWKVGAVGTGFFTWGMIDALNSPEKRVFGGYYSPGDKRDPSDAKFGTIRLGPVTIPWVLAHSPMIESANLGNTIMRVAMSRLRKSDSTNRGLIAGTVAGLFGMFERAPIASSALRLSKMGEPGQQMRPVDDIIQGLIPQFVQNIAADLDKRAGEPIKRKPEGVIDSLKMGVPGLRQTVPENMGRHHYGGKGKTIAAP